MSPLSKGEQTRAAILDRALDIASRLGLEGLTIGSLAEATGMSKSGLFAHFGSREELQLAVLEHGAHRFGEHVLAPAVAIGRGLPRLRALFEHWLDWTASSGLAGGCILLSAAHEYDDRPGPIRDAVAAGQRRGLAVIERAVRLAIEERHLRPDADAAQIAFEMLGLILATHNHRRLLGDREARNRALAAFDNLMSRYASARPAAGRRAGASR
ncbi:MAG: TetR/AcrR family transcriptional regulator [Burkholderiales bacterium]|nr:TetR/AcrR family transcriptional regulator [Burkholderiales bacterium]